MSQHRQSQNDQQISALSAENAKYMTELEQLREQNQVLQSQLASEKEKNLIESSRSNTLNRKLKEFEVAKIMAVQSDAGVNTSVDNMSLKNRSPEEILETEEQMMDIARQRISTYILDPVSHLLQLEGAGGGVCSVLLCIHLLMLFMSQYLFYSLSGHGNYCRYPCSRNHS